MLRFVLPSMIRLQVATAAGMLLAFQFGAAQEDSLRTWTNLEGRTVRASLVDANETHALLQLENGTQSSVLVSSLSAADITFLKSANTAPTAIASTDLQWPTVINVKPKELEITVGKQDSATRRFHYTSGSFEFITTAPLANAVMREVAADFELVREAVRQLPWGWVPQAKDSAYFRVFIAETKEDYIALGGGDNRGTIKDGNGITNFASMGLKQVGQRYAYDRRSKSEGEVVSIVASLLTYDMRGHLMPWSHTGLTNFLRDVAYQNGKITFQGLESSMKRVLKDRERYKFEADRLMEYFELNWDDRRSDADIILHRYISDSMLLFYYFGFMDGAGTGGGLHAYFQEVSKAALAARNRDPNRSREPASVQRRVFLDRLLAGRSIAELKADILTKYRALGVKFD